MSLLAYPLAAMGGGVLGAIAHEASHAVAAHVLGEIVAVGWVGGVTGGPYVDFHVESRWRTEVVRKAPLALGVVAAIVMLLSFSGLSVAWMFGVGFVAGLVLMSPEDLFTERAEAAATS